MRPLFPTLAVALALTTTACATPEAPQGPGSSADGADCAVLAAIAKEHYRFGPDNVPPPLRFDEGYSPRCDWSRHGLSFTPFDPNATGGDPRQRVRWVSFGRPRYDGQGAVVETGIMHGPLAGMGYECRVVSGFAGWTVPQGACRRTWVS